MYFGLSCLILLSLLVESKKNIDFKNSIVWGPGLDPSFNMPVRYFYIQVVDDQFKK